MDKITPHEAQLCRRRVMKEYSDMMEDPIPHVLIGMDPGSHLDIYCLINGLDEPYIDGEYILHLHLSPRYPLAPPDFFMLTPNGRFEVKKKLCFSNSSYHGETWSPIWTIRKLILGFLSFFLENQSKGVGHLSSTSEEKQNLAKASRGFNETNSMTILEIIKSQNHV
jgi:ubiquitin-protein ligase